MDKTVGYDEPLDPHWERLNAMAPTLFQLLHPDAAGFSEEVLEGFRGLRPELDARLDELLETDKSPGHGRIEHHLRENVVPFATRQVRAREMRENLDRAHSGGHFEKHPVLDATRIAFQVFAGHAESLGFANDKPGGEPKHRDEWLDIYHRAWETLRQCESEGFPLMDYVDSPALDGPEIVGTLVIEKLTDGTIFSVAHEPLQNDSGES